MKILTDQERSDTLNFASSEAVKILYMAFILCDLKTHIHLTCEFEGKPFKMTFEPIKPESNE